MGYLWIKNTDPALWFDAFIFRQAVIAAIKIKKIRHAVDENAFVEKFFPDEVEDLRSLPLPRTCSVSSGYGRRTNVHGAGFISCRLLQQRLSSIQLKTTITLTSMRRSGGMHHSGSTSPFRLKRGMKSDKPVKCPVWQTDEGEISLSKNGVHAHGKY
jgi:hypothetical protein